MKKLFVFLAALVIGLSTAAQDTFDNEVYFRFGYSNPSWKQFGGDRDFWGDGAKKWGVMGEVGTIFMLAKFGNPENMAVGLDVSYLSVYYNQFSQTVDNIDYDLGTLMVDSKVGPSFTFSPVSRMAIDVYVKGVANWYTATALVEDDDIGDADVYQRVFCLGFSTGINFRYSILMLGFEFRTVSPKLENIEEDGDFLGNVKNNDGERSPLPSVNFTVGLSF